MAVILVFPGHHTRHIINLQISVPSLALEAIQTDHKNKSQEPSYNNLEHLPKDTISSLRPRQEHAHPKDQQPPCLIQVNVGILPKGEF